MAYDPALAQSVAAALAARGLTVVQKRMFGGVAFLLDGKMALGVLGAQVVVKVQPGRRDALLRAHAESRVMDFTGRGMRGFVYVDGSVASEPGALGPWIDEALAALVVA